MSQEPPPPQPHKQEVGEDQERREKDQLEGKKSKEKLKSSCFVPVQNQKFSLRVFSL